jgi:hypothetical protein
LRQFKTFQSIPVNSRRFKTILNIWKQFETINLNSAQQVSATKALSSYSGSVNTDALLPRDFQDNMNNWQKCEDEVRGFETCQTVAGISPKLPVMVQNSR